MLTKHKFQETLLPDPSVGITETWKITAHYSFSYILCIMFYNITFINQLLCNKNMYTKSHTNFCSVAFWHLLMPSSLHYLHSLFVLCHTYINRKYKTDHGTWCSCMWNATTRYITTVNWRWRLPYHNFQCLLHGNTWIPLFFVARQCCTYNKENQAALFGQSNFQHRYQQLECTLDIWAAVRCLQIKQTKLYLGCF